MASPAVSYYPYPRNALYHSIKHASEPKPVVLGFPCLGRSARGTLVPSGDLGSPAGFRGASPPLRALSTAAEGVSFTGANVSVRTRITDDLVQRDRRDGY